MILVTVGTTAFDSLIRQIDTSISLDLDIRLQIANGNYLPQNFSWFRFSSAISSLYEEADFIICHAGAGTVYRLLEMRKKIIVVPNLNRSDPHQRELAFFVESNRYGMVCWDYAKIQESIENIEDFRSVPFVKPPFMGGDLILKLIHQLHNKK
jgi:beta-1,4-N-acetylglucosaminyltransferase